MLDYMRHVWSSLLIKVCIYSMRKCASNDTNIMRFGQILVELVWGANCLDYFLEIKSLVSLCIKLFKSYGWYHWKARNFAHLMRHIPCDYVDLCGSTIFLAHTLDTPSLVFSAQERAGTGA